MNKFLMEYTRGVYIKIAETELYLDDLLADYRKLYFHLPTWANTRFLKLLLYILYSIRVGSIFIYYKRNQKVVLFGTKLIPFYVVLKFIGVNCDYIMNELPNGRRENLYRIFLKDLRVGVSNQSRIDYLNRSGWKCDFFLVPNMTKVHGRVDKETKNRRNGAVYIGTITSKRIGDKLKNFITMYPTDFYGRVYGDAHGLNVMDFISQDKLYKVLSNYQYGILSYNTDEPNYDLCAPLKLFDYLNADLIPVSVNRNTSFVDLNEKYPHLIAFADSMEILDFDEHERSKINYLRDSENILKANFYGGDF